MISGVYLGLASLVVKYSLKSSLYSNSFSPNLIILRPALIMKFFSRMGSMVGSISSSTPSNKKGFPNLIQFSNCFRKAPAPSLILQILKAASFLSLFLIHLTACSWGSIHKGHLEALVVRIPFYTDNSSEGNSSLAH